MKQTILILRIIVIIFVTNPIVSIAQDWSPVVTMDGSVFPSHVLATASASQISGGERIVNISNQPIGTVASQNQKEAVQPETEQRRRSWWERAAEAVVDIAGAVSAIISQPPQFPEVPDTYIGDRVGSLGITYRPTVPNQRIRVQIEVPSIGAEGSIETYLTTPNVEYDIFPLIEYNYDQLVGLVQPRPAHAIFKVWVNEEYLGERRTPIRVRSIGDVPFFMVNERGTQSDLSWMFAAYVNEDHPWIDPLLREVLNNGVVNSFVGYQQGAEMVRMQVYAIWNTLQRRNVAYSNITSTSGSSERVASQHVRSFSETISNAQANCVDGSVLMASILRKIGIDPVLIMIPGHMYLGYYTDQSKNHIDILETTMIGQVNYASHVMGFGFNTNSWNSFVASLQYGNQIYFQRDRERLQRRQRGYAFIDVSSMRQAGVMPVPR